MKKRTLSLFFVAGISVLALSSYKSSPGLTAVGNRTGAAGSTASCSGGCHAASSSKTLASFVVADATAPGIPVSKYVPGKLYTVTIAGTNTSLKPKFGFQAAVTNSGGTNLGTLTATAGSTAVHTAGAINLVEHTAAITGTTPGAYTVKFNWTAPAKGSGTATFYGILNAVDGLGSDSNDEPSNGFKLDITEDLSAAISEHTRTNTLQIVPNPATDRIRIENLNSTNARIAVYGMNGAQLLVADAGNELNISMLPSGSYMVHVNDNGNLSSSILIKQ